jgi:hypothetical protein
MKSSRHLPGVETMSATTIQQRNRELAQKLLDEAERDAQSAYRNKFIGIANGQVVAVSEDWLEVSRRLRELEPDADKTGFLEIGKDGREVDMIGPLPRVCRAPSASTGPPLNAIQIRNRELADKLIEDAKRDPSAIAEKYVGIANGNIVVVSDELSEIARRLKQVEPDPGLTFVVEPRRDYKQVCEIWGIK